MQCDGHSADQDRPEVAIGGKTGKRREGISLGFACAPFGYGPGYAGASAGTGSAVTDLIFSIAKREVTFFNATVPISFL